LCKTVPHVEGTGPSHSFCHGPRGDRNLPAPPPFLESLPPIKRGVSCPHPDHDLFSVQHPATNGTWITGRSGRKSPDPLDQLSCTVPSGTRQFGFSPASRKRDLMEFRQFADAVQQLTDHREYNSTLIGRRNPGEVPTSTRGHCSKVTTKRRSWSSRQCLTKAGPHHAITLRFFISPFITFPRLGPP